MADQDVLPRLADALLDVGTRLSQIGEELRDLRVTGDAAQPQSAAAGEAATPDQAGAPQPGAAQQAAAGQTDQTPVGQPAAAGHPSAPPQDAATQPGVAQQAAASYPTAPLQPPVGYPGPGYQPPAIQAPQPDWMRPPITAASHTGQLPQEPFQRTQQFGQAPPPPGTPQFGQQVRWDRLPPEPPKPLLWERLSRDGAGSRLLAWAGGVVTLAGVVLLLVLAIQRGWLGPLPRVLLGAGLGLALAGIGMRLHVNPTSRIGAYAVGSTGVAVLFLDVVAATSDRKSVV